MTISAQPSKTISGPSDGRVSERDLEIALTGITLSGFDGKGTVYLFLSRRRTLPLSCSER